jgi:hypothetical protein
LPSTRQYPRNRHRDLQQRWGRLLQRTVSPDGPGLPIPAIAPLARQEQKLLLPQAHREQRQNRCRLATPRNVELSGSRSRLLGFVRHAAAIQTALRNRFQMLGAQPIWFRSWYAGAADMHFFAAVMSSKHLGFDVPEWKPARTKYTKEPNALPLRSRSRPAGAVWRVCQ